MGLYAGRSLDLEVPRKDKRLHTFIETDGCALDGVAAATGCSAGRRTMHIYDFGKVAATFVDRQTHAAVRISPNPDARFLAELYAPEEPDNWHAYLAAYQAMADEVLFRIQPVELTVSLEALIGLDGVRVRCIRCGEEVYNRREVETSAGFLCRACAGQAYYALAEKEHLSFVYQKLISQPVYQNKQ